MGLSERPLALICQVNTNTYALSPVNSRSQQQLTSPSIRTERGDFPWGRLGRVRSQNGWGRGDTVVELVASQS